MGVLVILGIIIGLLNVTAKESSGFLLASLALVIVSILGQSVLNTIIPQIGSILNMLLIIFIPATVIVALKTIFEISKN